MRKVGILCGGSGSSKFARAFNSRTGNYDWDLAYIANVGDNFWHRGLYICPDVDILLYALSRRLDTSKGWGVSSDSFSMGETMESLTGKNSWFGLGDRDLTLSLRRTQLLQRGWSLSATTDDLGLKLGIRNVIVPSTDDPIETHIQTRIGLLHLQEYWVKNKAELSVEGVTYVGIEKAAPNNRMLDYIDSHVIICPANPITSILPSVEIQGVREKLKRSRVVAISPFIGKKPVSGPAGVLMRALNIETSSLGIAKLYSDFLDLLVVDSSDDPLVIKEIRDRGVECMATRTRITSTKDEVSIAKEIFDIL